MHLLWCELLQINVSWKCYLFATLHHSFVPYRFLTSLSLLTWEQYMTIFMSKSWCVNLIMWWDFGHRVSVSYECSNHAPSCDADSSCFMLRRLRWLSAVRHPTFWPHGTNSMRGDIRIVRLTLVWIKGSKEIRNVVISGSFLRWPRKLV